MSSKLYQKYLSLKNEDSTSYYLFQSGIFYIFIADDAVKIAPILDLKLTNLNANIMKCGFPVSSTEKYFRKFKELNLNVKVIALNDMSHTSSAKEHINIIKSNKIIDEFLKINIDNLSISQAFDLLYNLQDKLKNAED